jgi:hypothetical protein
LQERRAHGFQAVVIPINFITAAGCVKSER